MSTAIEWTDEVWNPMTGCTEISAGCDHCYARVVANRRTRDIYLGHAPINDTPRNRKDPFAPRFWKERLLLPRQWREPRRVFVNSMSDVFHAAFSGNQIRAVFETMNALPRHQFQVLTKRPERALRLARDLTWSDNIWIGTSIEDMRVAHRANTLRQIPAGIRFVSAEPLLGPLEQLDLTGIQWVIGGGESGTAARPCDINWARGLRDQCVMAGVAFFWKQWGGKTSKAGGRDLDGKEWSQFPSPVTRGG